MKISKMSARKPTFSTPASSLSYSRMFGSRLDLDSTRVPTSQKSNQEHKLDIAYNEYLQSLMKQRIVKTAIKNFENVLQQQLDYQQELIIKMKEDCTKSAREVDDLQKRNELLKVLQNVEQSFQKYEESFGNAYRVDELINFSNMLSTASKDLQLVGIKKLVNKEEWLSLFKLMNDCCKFLNGFFKSNGIKEFQLIDQVSEGMHRISFLQCTIQDTVSKSSYLKKEMCTKYLQEMSDFFRLLAHNPDSGTCSE
ncbi:hypothetical protein HHI36_003502 [Cryptolaemus montrouzieri]|uniref:Uncharacterized protein n=1 Tax=Cryptolaemus montrouzieri TaxID=559131 RepID=A0ABD2PE40_9CUCU